MGLFSKKHKELEPSSQAAPELEKADFDSMAPEIPLPPADSLEMPSSSPGMPPLGPPQPQGAAQGANVNDDKKEFELPDFDDSDMVKEEPPPVVKKEPEKKPEPVKMPPKPAPPSPQQPAEELQHRFMDQKESFLYVLDYLNAREASDEISELLAGTSQGISRHSAESKAKDEKYASLIKELNVLQEKLIDIDTKLFEEV
jgi:hypothetical protein